MSENIRIPFFSKTWYQCWIADGDTARVFGFCVEDGVIITSGEVGLKGCVLQEVRQWFLQRKAIVTKIADLKF